MNTLELLYNKALMKAAADQTENVKKTKVWSIYWKNIPAIDLEIFIIEICENAVRDNLGYFPD